jgi:Tfp pilus assembly protein PilO
MRIVVFLAIAAAVFAVAYVFYRYRMKQLKEKEERDPYRELERQYVENEISESEFFERQSALDSVRRRH